MAEFLEVLKNRRSVRNYIADKDVPEELLNQVLEAVRWSPSWANTQCWEVIVIKNPETKEKLQQVLEKGNPGSRAMVEAPVVLGICGKQRRAGFYKDQPATRFGDWYMFDLGLATQSLCLAAQDLGLGTVIIGLFDHDGAKKILDVPEQYELVVLVPLGFPARGSGAPKRKEKEEFTHRERFTS